MKQKLLAALICLGFASCGSTKPPNLGQGRTEADEPQQTQKNFKPRRGNPEHAVFRSASGCGVERWSIKTLTDPGANQVTLRAQDSSIADLTSIVPPRDPTDRVNPTEATTFRISGTITFAKREKDSDIHLVIVDQQGNSMIIESADPACAAGSVVFDQISQVRQAVLQKIPSLGRVSVPATVEGVGFFDRIHGQTGVAPNGIELHPLTRFQ